MKNLENQRGYALLIVLLTIIIFLSLSAAFMSASINHVSQEKKVDQHNQTYVAAEMGVKFIHSQLLNEYETQTPIQLQFAQQRINSFYEDINEGTRNKSELQTEINSIRSDIGNSIMESINTILTDIQLENEQDITESTSFKLVSFNLSKSNYNVLLNGKIEGINNNNNTSLNLDLEFPVSNLDISENEIVPPPTSEEGTVGDGSSDSLPSFSPPSFWAMIPDSTQLSNCNNNYINRECKSSVSVSFDNISNSKIHFSNYNYSSNMNSDLANSVIYNNGSFSGTNWMGIENVSFFVNGTIKLENVKRFENVYIQANESMDIKNSNGKEGFKNSTLYLNGSFSADQLELNKSLISAQESVSIKNHLSMINNSKICIDGNIAFGGKVSIDDTSEIFYTGSYSGGNFKKNDKKPKKISITTLASKCLILNPNEYEVDEEGVKFESKIESVILGEPSIDVKY